MSQSQKACVSIFVSFLLSLAALVATSLLFPVYAAPVSVSVTGAGNMPLVVVRFNQRKVYYERQLYMAAQKAVQTKPNVQFNLVSYVPVGTSEDANARLMNQASKHAKQVADSLAGMGIPAQHIHMTSRPDHEIEHDEVHIYVQ